MFDLNIALSLSELVQAIILGVAVSVLFQMFKPAAARAWVAVMLAGAVAFAAGYTRGGESEAAGVLVALSSFTFYGIAMAGRPLGRALEIRAAERLVGVGVELLTGLGHSLRAASAPTAPAEKRGKRRK
ncbi:MAG: hypothetical protein Q8R28_02955 [Dehalococcoidia bacterium]|nr:hypothetical protein [Dehalococcoidia bacterium]